MMVRNQIIVVGGYGTVGQQISRRLVQYIAEDTSGLLPSYDVIAAGRNAAAAEAFSQSTNGQIQPLQWDIQSSPDTWPDLSAARLLIMCLDLTDTTLVEYCLNHGIHYMDITANGEYLQQIQQLKIATQIPLSQAVGAHTSLYATTPSTHTVNSIIATATATNIGTSSASPMSIALISIGLAPGLTNLLGAAVHQEMDHTDQLDISIMLGLGERHGEAAIRWTVEQLGSSFTIMSDGQPMTVSSLTDGRVVAMPYEQSSGRQYVYRFPFSDQQTLAQTLHVPTVSTRLGFDSVLLTRLLAGVQKLGVFRLLRFAPVQQAMISLFGSIHAGSDRYAIRIDAKGSKDGKPVQRYCVLHGHNQSHATAEVTALAAMMLLELQDHLPGGVQHIEQVLEWKTFAARLQRHLPFEMMGLDHY
ncbi:saccharopine dehydrogenase family protein [Paenibacillus sp. WLX2291]|uniref:saccharopine dehydrogenase family protein n=1 Tax=Paenibacillus sp. WLX2291 TaxID=3296934 RepID=UPI003983E5A4